MILMKNIISYHVFWYVNHIMNISCYIVFTVEVLRDCREEENYVQLF